MPSSLDMSNVQIVNAIRDQASADFQARVPAATRGNLAKTFEILNQYQPLMNEFITGLVDRIGLEIFQTNSFNNQLKNLKRGNMNYGGTIQEMQAGLIQGQQYDPDNTNPFGAPKPDIEVNYYNINRQNTYPMRYNRSQLELAFTNEGGLSDFLTLILNAPTISDEWDEYLIMRNLIKGAHDAWDVPTFKVGDLFGAGADQETIGKGILQAMREHYLKMRDFINTQYNAKHMPVSSDEIMVLGTPRFFASVDVNVLAAAFHMDRANFISDRTIVIDDFNIEGVDVALIDRSAYVCADNLYATDTIYNPATRDWITYLHHWGTYALSNMRNMLLFSSTEDTNLGQVNATSVTSVTLSLASAVSNNAVLEPGAEIALTPKVTYSDSTNDQAVYYLITNMSATAPADTSAPSPNVIEPDTGTYIDAQNVLHVSRMSKYDTLNITAFAAKDNTKLANILLHDKGYKGEK